jgi:hypothetical protein
MTTATLLLALALAAPAPAANPTCAPPTPGRLEAPSVYATFVVDGLGWVRKGTGRMPDTAPADVSVVLAAFGRTQEDFACAGRYFAPFVKSDAGPIRTSAESLVTRCARVREATGAMATALETQAAGAGDGKPFGASADERLAEAIDRKDQAWGKFMVALAESIGVVVEFQDGKPTGRLLVTRPERQALKARLEKIFGKEIQGGRKDGQEPLTTIAAAWYEILVNPQFRALDDR